MYARRPRPMAVRWVAAVTAAAAAATLSASGPATAERGGGAFSPGAPGVGDPYYKFYGNGGYDVGHYDIHDSYNVANGRLVGRTRLTATATKNLSRFNLDLVLKADSVTVNGDRARYARAHNQELVITPRSGLPDGQVFTVVVKYHGYPNRIDGPGLISPWVRNKTGAVAVGEPQIAAWWFPSNDHPRDKATFDVNITVPRGTQAISNGSLESRQTFGNRTRWSWSAAEPMATYLAFMAIGKYEIESGTDPGGRPYLYAFSKGLNPDTLRSAKRDIRQTARLTRFEETKFGRYPFDQVGGVVPGGKFFFALENQTRPVYTRYFFNSFNFPPFVIVHEQAHQWYGDAVAVHNWRDIWLNEGFASYSEFLFAKKRFDVSPQRQFVRYYSQIGRRSPFWDVKIGNPGKNNEFASPVYGRGAMTLQALRNRLGHADFFALLRSWARKRDNGRIAQFINRAEGYAGHPLRRFFDVWLYTPRKPKMTEANGFGDAASRFAGTPAEQRRTDRVVDLMMRADKMIAAAEAGGVPRTR